MPSAWKEYKNKWHDPTSCRRELNKKEQRDVNSTTKVYFTSSNENVSKGQNLKVIPSLSLREEV